ncbi:hypothetical protein Hdeb2414_s0003g00110821 [Helianthus debilis subsp. tardiflorus]
MLSSTSVGMNPLTKLTHGIWDGFDANQIQRAPKRLRTGVYANQIQRAPKRLRTDGYTPIKETNNHALLNDQVFRNVSPNTRFTRSSNVDGADVNYTWQGILAKGGTPVCRARCVPIGDWIGYEICKKSSWILSMADCGQWYFWKGYPGENTKTIIEWYKHLIRSMSKIGITKRPEEWVEKFVSALPQEEWENYILNLKISREFSQLTICPLIEKIEEQMVINAENKKSQNDDQREKEQIEMKDDDKQILGLKKTCEMLKSENVKLLSDLNSLTLENNKLNESAKNL